MIQGPQIKKTTQLDQELANLESMYTQFYLTGSRFFRNERPDSDYDFFVADSEAIRKLLRKNGYKQLSWYSYEGGPLDDNCAVVYRKIVNSQGTNAGPWDATYYTHIDIQLQKDVKKKIAAQDALKKSGILLFQRNKTTVHMLWTLVYNLLDSK